jgi:hypothetical protein
VLIIEKEVNFWLLNIPESQAATIPTISLSG